MKNFIIFIGGAILFLAGALFGYDWPHKITKEDIKISNINITMKGCSASFTIHDKYDNFITNIGGLNLEAPEN